MTFKENVRAVGTGMLIGRYNITMVSWQSFQ